MKVAGHELKNLAEVYHFGPPRLRVPLACIVDYLGWRLLAISYLPIHEGTIKYGSMDQGLTLHRSDQEMNETMAALGTALNLKPQFVPVRRDGDVLNAHSLCESSTARSVVLPRRLPMEVPMLSEGHPDRANDTRDEADMG